MTSSTVHRLLSTLTDEGMLEQDASTGRYQLGLLMFDLEAAVSTQRNLHAAVLSPMTDLRNSTGETVQVGVLDGREVVYVERLDSPNTLRIFTELGRRHHAHCTSSGKALLAFSNRGLRDRTLKDWSLPRQTDSTITDLSELRSELAAIRRHGFAQNRQESEVGVMSFAAPIRDGSGEAIAAISVAGPAERLATDHAAFSEAVVAIAQRASRRMGWEPPS